MNTPIKLQATHYENLFRALLQSINEFDPKSKGISYKENGVEREYPNGVSSKEAFLREYFITIELSFGYWKREYRFDFSDMENIYDYPVYDILRERAYSFSCRVIVNRGWRFLFWPIENNYYLLTIGESDAIDKADAMLRAYNDFCDKEAARSYGIVEEDD